MRYTIVVDNRWYARRASVAGRSARGQHVVLIESVSDGRWHIDGEQRPDLDGCLDIDCESSARQRGELTPNQQRST